MVNNKLLVLITVIYNILIFDDDGLPSFSILKINFIFITNFLWFYDNYRAQSYGNKSN